MNNAVFDVRQLEQFRDRMERLSKNTEQIARAVIEEMAARIMRGAVKRSPVDTGYLRGSWKLSGVVRFGGTYKVSVYNTADYAFYVENGHRIVDGSGNTIGWKDGVFMLELSVREVEARVDAIMQQKVDKMIKKELGL